MSEGEADLAKIRSIIFPFFKVRKIKESLNSIKNNKISGWEKWLQIELAMYLARSSDVAEWNMEYVFKVNKKFNAGRSFIYLDLGFRLKKHSKSEWFFVDIKQHDDYQKCIDGMTKDFQKVITARKRSLRGVSIRYIACAGIFISQDKRTVKKYVENIMNDLKITSQGIYIDKINKHHSLIIF